MSVTRFFRWTCEYCGYTVNRPDERIPDHWKQITSQGYTGHVCNNCVPKLIETGWEYGNEPGQLVK